MEESTLLFNDQSTVAGWQKPGGLRRRINLLGFGVTVSSTMAIGITILLVSLNTLWTDTMEDARATAELVGRDNHRLLTGLVMEEDPELLMQYRRELGQRFENLGIFPGIRGAMLLDANGEELTSVSNEGQAWNHREFKADTALSDGSQFWQMMLGKGWRIVVRDIALAEEKLATLYIKWDLRRLRDHVYQQLLVSALLFTVVLVVVTFVTLRLRRSISQPVEELVNRTANVVRHGDLSKLRPARVFGNDELGRLTASFNSMIDTLREQYAELNAGQQLLERRVARRTEELDAKRREAEDSRRELQQVLDLSLDVMTIIDSAERLVMYSPAVTAVLGYEEPEWLALSLSDVVFHSDRTQNDEQIISPQQLLRQHGGKVRQAERRLKHRDGHWVWMEWSMTLLDDDRVFLIGRDIQERKKREIEVSVAHKAETLARKRTQQIVDISLDMIVTMDSNGRFLSVSKASKSLFGYEPDELRGRLFAEFIVAEDFEGDIQAENGLKLAVEAHGGQINGLPRRFRHADGHLVWVEWNVVFQPEENAFYAVARDITERRRYEHELIDAQQKTQEVIDFSPDLICTLDRNGIFTSVNEASRSILGYEPGSLVGKDLAEYLHADDLSMHRFTLVVEEIEHHRGELDGLRRRFRHQDGHWVWIEWNLVLTDRGARVHANGRDVSENIRYQQELIAAREAAEEATRAKSDFLSNMSHEIRTPLNGVMGMLQLLEATHTDAEQEDYLRTAINSGGTLLTLINDILDFSKIEAGKLVLENEPFSLLEMVEDVVAQFGDQSAIKGINLSVVYDVAAPTHVHGDVVRLRQVLSNLLGNAMKFTSAGEIYCQVRVAEGGEKPGLSFAVVDTGIGIAEDKLEEIFESFSQADNSTTRRFGGTGLGLAIARDLIELMGGEIQVSSELGKGTTFSFELPLHAAPQPEFRIVSLLDKRVLVIAETEAVRSSIVSSCRRVGMVVTAIPVWEHSLPELLVDGSAFDVVVADSVLLQGEVGRKWVDNPILPTLVIAPYGKQLKGLPAQFRQLYKPIRSGLLVDHLQELLGFERESSCQQAVVRKVQHGKLLLVEDNAVNRKVAIRLLKKMGMDVEIAVNGQEAVEQVRCGTFDLVLMDCQMPVMDGYAATREIRRLEAESGGHQTIIAVTANAGAEFVERCRTAGMDDYLAKPFQFDAMAEKLHFWLSGAPVAVPGQNALADSVGFH